MSTTPATFETNARRYAWPDQPLVVVCIDGSEPAYMEQAIAAGAMPYLAKALQHGSDLRGHCVVPSFTNPNNLSIITGVPPAVHGICGNFLYDAENDAEVMMNDPRFLRAPTIFQTVAGAGGKVVIITAKDKLRSLLGHGLTYGEHGAICFSSEKSDTANVADNGIDGVVDMVGMPVPSVYSAQLSEFVFAAGVKLMERVRPDVMYLSTTDYIQHKHAPGSPVANDFYRMMDGYWAQLDELGATLALTADHGMQDKYNAAGAPDVIYLQTLMDEWLGTGRARVILPITDPYVVHHGALGGFATIYLPGGTDQEDVVAKLSAVDGIELAIGREDGCARFELPPDRLGDVIVISGTHKVLGTSADRHDLSALKEPLRSHGGLSEQNVPLVFNRRVVGLDPARQLRNFDVFDLALNHTQSLNQRKVS